MDLQEGRVGIGRRPVPQLGAITDIVWLQTAFLGDIIISTAAFGAARRLFPAARQHVITTAIGKAALKDHDAIDSLIVFDKKTDSMRRAVGKVRRELGQVLASRGGAVLLQPHKSFRSSLLARSLALPTVTYDESSLAFLAAVRLPRVAILHEAERISLLLTALGVSREQAFGAKPAMPALPLGGSPGWRDDLARYPGRLVGIAPGSIWGTKRWPTEYFAVVAKRLLEDASIGIVLLGSKDEREATDEIAGAVDAAGRVWNVAGATGLDDLRRIYPRLSLVLANDSSPIHYASAFNVPTVAVFGATVPALGFGPLADRHVVMGIDGLPCRPCSDHGPRVCPLTHFKCMRTLSADEVYKACRKVLMDPVTPS